jgi:hypothetical protein
MSDLQILLDAANAARIAFEGSVPRLFPGRDHWDWTRACAAVKGENVRRNDDTSQDEAMAAHPAIRALHAEYIQSIQAYYRLRDGDKGFLGGKGL